jgi:hypothetical protein
VALCHVSRWRSPRRVTCVRGNCVLDTYFSFLILRDPPGGDIGGGGCALEEHRRAIPSFGAFASPFSPDGSFFFRAGCPNILRGLFSANCPDAFYGLFGANCSKLDAFDPPTFSAVAVLQPVAPKIACCVAAATRSSFSRWYLSAAPLYSGCCEALLRAAVARRRLEALLGGTVARKCCEATLRAAVKSRCCETQLRGAGASSGCEKLLRGAVATRC